MSSTQATIKVPAPNTEYRKKSCSSFLGGGGVTSILYPSSSSSSKSKSFNYEYPADLDSSSSTGGGGSGKFTWPSMSLFLTFYVISIPWTHMTFEYIYFFAVGDSSSKKPAGKEGKLARFLRRTQSANEDSTSSIMTMVREKEPIA